MHYRPIEAAIRWSGLTRHERQILAALAARPTIDVPDFPRWPTLKLNADRIYDALVNRELPFFLHGEPARDDALTTNPNITLRHVDLRRWMSRYYPGDRPAFLFDGVEQASPLTIDTLNIFVQGERLQSLMDRAQHVVTTDASSITVPQRSEPLNQVKESATFIGTRGETTYLHIVGSLVGLLLGRAPSGQPYSTFRSQEAVIDALVAHYGDRIGISERTLQSKFAAAKRALDLT